MRKLFFVVGSAIIFLSSCDYESVEPKTEIVITDSIISYSKTIKPLVTTQCSGSVGCHESGSQDGDFTDYDGLKDKASDESLLKRVVTIKDMPKRNLGFDLTDQERSYFAAWIRQGFPNN